MMASNGTLVDMLHVRFHVIRVEFSLSSFISCMGVNFFSFSFVLSFLYFVCFAIYARHFVFFVSLPPMSILEISVLAH